VTAAFEPFGEARRLVFPSGLRVLYQRTARLPVVAIAAAIEAGSAADPPGRAGLATLTVELLRTGTEAHDEEALAGAFADLGTSLRAERGQDWVDVSTQALARDFERCLFLVAEVVRRPTFAAEKLERVRRELFAEKNSSRARAEDILIETFYRAVYAGHPYETPLNGTEASLAALDREAVWAFHARTYVPARTVLAIVGDVDEKRCARAVEEAFGDWESPACAGSDGSSSAPPLFGARPAGARVFFVHKPDQKQAHVRIGHALVPRAHEDWDRLILANHILGGAGLASRIADIVRTKNGLAYSAGSFLVPRRLAGPFAASAQTKSESCVRAIELMLGEIERLRAEPLPEADLEVSRSYFLGSLPFRLETNGHKAGALLEAELYGLGPDHLRRQIESIRALTAGEVRDAARRRLDPAAATIVVVGERERVLSALEALGPVKEEPLP
jgi:zinc protease